MTNSGLILMFILCEFTLSRFYEHVVTYLPTVMWKFPATLLTYRCPCILQELKELDMSSLWGKTYRRLNASWFITDIIFLPISQVWTVEQLIFGSCTFEADQEELLLSRLWRVHPEESAPFSNAPECAEESWQKSLKTMTHLEWDKTNSVDKTAFLILYRYKSGKTILYQWVYRFIYVADTCRSLLDLLTLLYINKGCNNYQLTLIN